MGEEGRVNLSTYPLKSSKSLVKSSQRGGRGARGLMFHRYRWHRWHSYNDWCWFKTVLTLFIDVDKYRINILSTSWASNLKQLTLQCCTISNQHCVDIAYIYLIFIVHINDIAVRTISNKHRVDITYLLLPCLHHSNCRHCNVVQYRINIMSILLTSN